MISIVKRNRYLILRRLVQFSILVSFIGTNKWGWTFLVGNLSAARVLDSFYLADPYAVLQIFASGFIVSSDLLVGAFIVLIFYATIGGRAFCSWVCPLNIITDSAAWLRRKLGFNFSSDNLRIKRSIRYWVLLLGLVLSAILGLSVFEMVSPIGMLHRGLIFGFGMGWAIVISVFLFDLVVMKNGWCGHFCPLGGFYSLSGKYALIEVKHKVEKCSDCMDCFKVCPEPQVLKIVTKLSGMIDAGECTNCGRCVDVCADSALIFSLKNIK